MPVYRVNYTMNGPTSTTSVGDNELPEADRYGNNVHDITRTYKLVSEQLLLHMTSSYSIVSSPTC